jgi:Kef-type K+ transport system membrane component KefB
LGLAYEIIIQILIVLAAAVLLGEVFEQAGLSSVPGELLSGMVLGPTFLNLIATNDQIQAVSSLALFFVIFFIGFEMNTDMLRKRVQHGVILSLTSFVIPMFAVFGVLLFLFPFGPTPDLVAALAISVPSISIISVLVMQYGFLETSIGGLILSSVAVSDIAAFIILVAVTTPLLNTVSVIAYTTIFVVAFLSVDLALNRQPKAFRRLLDRVGVVVRREDMSYAVLILVGLLVASIFQTIGLSYILGAFFAGLIVKEGLIGRKAFREVSTTFTRINRAFFIPIFFGSAGLEADLTPSGYHLIPALGIVMGLVLLLSIATTRFAGKAIMRLTVEDARRVSVTLGGRGAVGIIIASVALSSGAITSLNYSLIIVATLVISLVVPVLLGRRRAVGQDAAPD